MMIDLLHNFQLLPKKPFPGSDETVEDNRCFKEISHEEIRVTFNTNVFYSD
jgi:hypothetical protein